MVGGIGEEYDRWQFPFFDRRKKYPAFLKLIPYYCVKRIHDFLYKSNDNVIAGRGSGHIPAVSTVSSHIPRLTLTLRTRYSNSALLCWFRVCCTITQSKGLTLPLQCGNQGANHGTLPLHWPWPNGKCCGKPENTGRYLNSISKNFFRMSLLSPGEWIGNKNNKSPLLND